MSDFAVAAEALKAWPARPVVVPGGTAGRLVAAMQGLHDASHTVGSSDLAGLTSQLLREEAASDGGEWAALQVPADAPWPSRIDWEAHALSVTLEVDGRFRLKPRAWHPTWLLGAQRQDPLAATLARTVRRQPSSVAGDPVWAELLELGDYLSPGQRAAVRASTLLPPGESLLVVLPTGGGKSLAAYAPAMLDALAGRTTVMVVPTTALALDQERRARQMLARLPGVGIPPRLAYYGGLEADEKEAFKTRLRDGAQPLVIASPEAVLTGLRTALGQAAEQGRVATLVVDEAHLVDQWGNEFRPEFQALAGLRRLLIALSPRGDALKTLLLTATLTQSSWDTLLQLFGTPDLNLVTADHLRPEPSYWIAKAPDDQTAESWISEALRVAPRPLILYTARPEDADAWAERLRSTGVRRVATIHGGTQPTDRQDRLAAWNENQIDIMVATSAFGVGMDKSNVRCVIHACVPETLDRYYQEVGRGGRDGCACVSLLVHRDRDSAVARSLNAQTLIGVDQGLVRWKAMYNGKSAQDEDGFVVYVDTVPPNLVGDTDANRAWNLRTLTLMARAGLVQLAAAALPRLEQGEFEPGDAFEARQLRAFERYLVSVEVRPTGVDHLSPEVWRSQVETCRQRTLRANAEHLQQVLDVLAGRQRIATSLEQAYTVLATGTKVRPQRVDGACPVSRVAGLQGGGYVQPEPTIRTHFDTSVRPKLHGLFARYGRALVVAGEAYSPEMAPEWRRKLLPVLRRLVALGVREVCCVGAWTEIEDYRRLYRSARPKLVFHTELQDALRYSSERLGVPRLWVVEPGHDIVEVLAQTRDEVSTCDVILMPDNMADPRRPDRPFFATRDHVTLAHLQRELA